MYEFSAGPSKAAAVLGNTIAARRPSQADIKPAYRNQPVHHSVCPVLSGPRLAPQVAFPRNTTETVPEVMMPAAQLSLAAQS
jgi:hypothetical protein